MSFTFKANNKQATKRNKQQNKKNQLTDFVKDKTRTNIPRKEKYIKIYNIIFTVIIHSATSILNIGQTVGPFNFLNKVKHHKNEQK